MGTSWRDSAATSPGFSRSHRPLVDAARTAALFASAKTHSPCDRIPGPQRLMQKRQLFPELRWASPGHVVLPRRIRGSERFRCQVLEYEPDSLSAAAWHITPRSWSRLPPSLRIDWLVSNGCSHETLLHIGPPGPLWSICYYHQDLHQGRLQPGSHPKAFCATPATFLLVEASGPIQSGLLCRQRSGMSGAL